MPTLAMLSGQKSALESIQATDYICHVALRQQSGQSATRKQMAPRNGGGSTTDTLPKVGVTSTAAWDGWDRAHLGALAWTRMGSDD